ncbi:MAG: hypothetical protein ACLFRY_13030 [Spirochaetia bacterium]
MGLYWKDIEITPGMILEVEEENYEVFTEDGRRARIAWKILALRERTGNDAYYDTDTGRTYALRKVMKSRGLLRKRDTGSLVQIPACTDYLVVEEFHDGKPAFTRCYSVDMLGLIRDMRIVENPDSSS